MGAYARESHNIMFWVLFGSCILARLASERELEDSDVNLIVFSKPSFFEFVFIEADQQCRDEK